MSNPDNQDQSTDIIILLEKLRYELSTIELKLKQLQVLIKQEENNE